MSDDRVKALDELRAKLEVVAERRLSPRLEPEKPPKRRWWIRHRRVALGAGAVVLAAGAAATAAELIGVGEEIRDRPDKSPRYAPGPHGSRVVATATDPAGGSVWGVATYQAANGQPCAIAGQLRGRQLGSVQAGLFRPYAANVSGVCGDLDRFETVVDVRRAGADVPRTLVYGRARPGVKAVEARHGRRVDRATVVDGAFLFVLEGYVAPTAVAVSAAAD